MYTTGAGAGTGTARCTGAAAGGRAGQPRRQPRELPLARGRRRRPEVVERVALALEVAARGRGMLGATEGDSLLGGSIIDLRTLPFSLRHSLQRF